MCFPSTLQPGRSVSLRGVTLARSPALDLDRTERKREENAKHQTQRGGKRTVRSRRQGERNRECPQPVQLASGPACFNPRDQIQSSLFGAWRRRYVWTSDVTVLKCYCVAPVLTERFNIIHTISGLQPLISKFHHQSFFLCLEKNATK